MASGDSVSWEPSLVRKPLVERTQPTCRSGLAHFSPRGSGDRPAEATPTVDPAEGLGSIAGGSWSLLCQLDLGVRATASTRRQPQAGGRCRLKPYINLLDPTNSLRPLERLASPLVWIHPTDQVSNVICPRTRELTLRFRRDWVQTLAWALLSVPHWAPMSCSKPRGWAHHLHFTGEEGQGWGMFRPEG